MCCCLHMQYVVHVMVQTAKLIQNIDTGNLLQNSICPWCVCVCNMAPFLAWEASPSPPCEWVQALDSFQGESCPTWMQTSLELAWQSLWRPLAHYHQCPKMSASVSVAGGWWYIPCTSEPKIKVISCRSFCEHDLLFLTHSNFDSLHRALGSIDSLLCIESWLALSTGERN